MKVLIACEESQTVCKAFREKGHEAYSCDIIECSGGHPEWHIKSDVLPLLNPSLVFDGYDNKLYGIKFVTCDGFVHYIEDKWDLIIAHPPCTYLTVTQNWCYNREKYGDEKVNEREKNRDEAIKFFLEFTKADCEKVAIENPVGCMSRMYQKPTQIIQPYYFGDRAKKTTCLWLKGLPKLEPTNIVDCGEIFEYKGKNGRIKKYPKWMYDALGKSPEERQRIRSKTFEGIANAMAEQWGQGVIPNDR
jgi:hypothetical protein